MLIPLRGAAPEGASADLDALAGEAVRVVPEVVGRVWGGDGAGCRVQGVWLLGRRVSVDRPGMADVFGYGREDVGS